MQNLNSSADMQRIFNNLSYLPGKPHRIYYTATREPPHPALTYKPKNYSGLKKNTFDRQNDNTCEIRKVHWHFL
jgi:hypothetical protein